MRLNYQWFLCIAVAFASVWYCTVSCVFILEWNLFGFKHVVFYVRRERSKEIHLVTVIRTALKL